MRRSATIEAGHGTPSPRVASKQDKLNDQSPVVKSEDSVNMAQRSFFQLRCVQGIILGSLALGLWACQNPTDQPQGQETNGPTSSPSLKSPVASPEPPSPSVAPESPPVTAPTEAGKAAVYWLISDAEKIAFASPTVLKSTQADADPVDQLKQALERLLQGPANADVFSTIPEGTTLNEVRIQPDGVHIDLSQEFTSGGGSASMQGRVGQVVYTATSLDPEEPIWLSIDGEPLTVLGGEGLEISQPMTRQKFQEEFSL